MIALSRTLRRWDVMRRCSNCDAQYDDSKEDHVVLEKPRAVSCIRVDKKVDSAARTYENSWRR